MSIGVASNTVTIPTEKGMIVCSRVAVKIGEIASPCALLKKKECRTVRSC